MRAQRDAAAACTLATSATYAAPPRARKRRRNRLGGGVRCASRTARNMSRFPGTGSPGAGCLPAGLGLTNATWARARSRWRRPFARGCQHRAARRVRCDAAKCRTVRLAPSPGAEVKAGAWQPLAIQTTSATRGGSVQRLAIAQAMAKRCGLAAPLRAWNVHRFGTDEAAPQRREAQEPAKPAEYPWPAERTTCSSTLNRSRAASRHAQRSAACVRRVSCGRSRHALSIAAVCHCALPQPERNRATRFLSHVEWLAAPPTSRCSPSTQLELQHRTGSIRPKPSERHCRSHAVCAVSPPQTPLPAARATPLTVALVRARGSEFTARHSCGLSRPFSTPNQTPLIGSVRQNPTVICQRHHGAARLWLLLRARSICVAPALHVCQAAQDELLCRSPARPRRSHDGNVGMKAPHRDADARACASATAAYHEWHARRITFRCRRRQSASSGAHRDRST